MTNRNKVGASVEAVDPGDWHQGWRRYRLTTIEMVDSEIYGTIRVVRVELVDEEQARE